MHFRMFRFVRATLISVVFLTCTPLFVGASPSGNLDVYRDPMTSSNYEAVRVEEYDLALTIDPVLHFDPERSSASHDGYSGSVRYLLQARSETKQIILDSVGIRIGRTRLDFVGSTHPEKSGVLFTDKRMEEYLNRELETSVDENSVTIKLPFTLKSGDWLAFEMELKGASYKGGLYFVPGTATRTGRPAAFTQLEAIDARKVFPCQDTPQSHSRFQTSIITPKGMKAFATGDRKMNGPTLNDGNVHRFESDFTIPVYLYALMVGDVESVRIGKNVEVVYEPEMKEEAVAYAKNTAQIIEYYERFLDYPFPLSTLRIGFVPGFPWGGMENMGFIFLQERFLVRDNVLLPNGIGVLPHEIVHHWYGNTVTMADTRHVWINEGPTTFLHMRYLEDTIDPGEAAMQWELRRKKSLAYPYNKNRDTKWGTLLSDAKTADDVTSAPNFSDRYDKGSWVLKEIEHRVGREGIRTILSEVLPLGEKKLLTARAFLRELLTRMEGYAQANNIDLDKEAAAHIQMLVTQPGYPEVEVECERASNGDLSSITLHQPDAVDGYVYPMGNVTYKTDHGYQQVTINRYTETVPVRTGTRAIVLDPRGARYLAVSYEGCSDLPAGDFVDVAPDDYRILTEWGDKDEFVTFLRERLMAKADAKEGVSFENLISEYPSMVSGALTIQYALSNGSDLTDFVLRETSVPLRKAYSETLFALLEPHDFDAKLLELFRTAMKRERAYPMQAMWMANLLLGAQSDAEAFNSTRELLELYLPLPGWDVIWEKLGELAERNPKGADIGARVLLRFGAMKNPPIPSAQQNMTRTLKENRDNTRLMRLMRASYESLVGKQPHLKEVYADEAFAFAQAPKKAGTSEEAGN